MEREAAEGRWRPTLITLGIAAVLSVWAAYAITAAIGSPLPMTRWVLGGIAAVYLVRGVGGHSADEVGTWVGAATSGCGAARFAWRLPHFTASDCSQGGDSTCGSTFSHGSLCHTARIVFTRVERTGRRGSRESTPRFRAREIPWCRCRGSTLHRLAHAMQRPKRRPGRDAIPARPAADDPASTSPEPDVPKPAQPRVCSQMRTVGACNHGVGPFQHDSRIDLRGRAHVRSSAGCAATSDSSIPRNAAISPECGVNTQAPRAGTAACNAPASSTTEFARRRTAAATRRVAGVASMPGPTRTASALSDAAAISRPRLRSPRAIGRQARHFRFRHRDRQRDRGCDSSPCATCRHPHAGWRSPRASPHRECVDCRR